MSFENVQAAQSQAPLHAAAALLLPLTAPLPAQLDRCGRALWLAVAGRRAEAAAEVIAAFRLTAKHASSVVCAGSAVNSLRRFLAGVAADGDDGAAAPDAFLLLPAREPCFM